MSVEEARERISRYGAWTKADWNAAVDEFVLEVRIETLEQAACGCHGCVILLQELRAELAKRKVAV